jgi:hypothetical protein
MFPLRFTQKNPEFLEKKIKWTYQAYPLFYAVVLGVLAVKTQLATRNFRLQSVLFDEVFDELE